MNKKFAFTALLLLVLGLAPGASAERPEPGVSEKAPSTAACDNLIEKGRSSGPAASRLARLTAEDFAADGKPLTDDARAVVAAREKSLGLWNQAFRVCLDAAEKADDSQTAAYLAARGYWIEGWRLEQSRSWAEARVVYEQGLEAVSHFGGATSPHLVPLHESLADLLVRDDHSRQEARAHLETALEIRRRAFGETSPRIAPGLVRLAMFHAEPVRGEGESSADSGQVEPLYRLALDLFEETRGEPKELFARTLRTYQLYLLGREEREKAESIRALAESHGLDLDEATPDWRYFWGRWVDREGAVPEVRDDS